MTLKNLFDLALRIIDSDDFPGGAEAVRSVPAKVMEETSRHRPAAP